MTGNEEIPIWLDNDKGKIRFFRDGHAYTIPQGWEYVPSGDATLTKRLKSHGNYIQCLRIWKHKETSAGLVVPSELVQREREALADERGTPEYARKLAASRRASERKQTKYEGEFRQAVIRFLNFAPRYAAIADKLADAVTAHAIPVGSGTVARTQTIPLETRAEAAVIAWMRHQTTAYDHMSIARIKGERREVRHRLAERSREVLANYRLDKAIDEAHCPLAQALKCLNAPEKPKPSPVLHSTMNSFMNDFFAEE